VIVWLSNFSINNNFSHFLHGLLRLFCALIDARYLVWDPKSNKFIQAVPYTIWLDENFKLEPEKHTWLKSMGGTIRHLKNNNCVSATRIVYGSGCVRFLSPEKWYGYPGCRASEVLPAFGAYMRQVHSGGNKEDLKILDEPSSDASASGAGLRVAYAVRDVGALTGKRGISNLGSVQALITKTQHVA
jgi:hypothetical protein